MQNNSTHAMFPEATHDEQSMQSFMRTLRVEVLRAFEGSAREALDDAFGPIEAGKIPPRKAMRVALQQAEPHRWWSSMLRVTQEMLYDTVGPSIERQLPALVEKAVAFRGRQGDLVLDPTLETPRYLSAVDIHCKPGSYQQELSQDDVFAGAEFDRTYRLYSMGRYGPNLDAMGWSLIAWIKAHYPDFKPRRILDMGCTVGHSTLPYAEAFGGDVEVHAIDVAAPGLRYGHARAAAMGRRVLFSQQNAEQTNFADGSFDLVVSHLLMHETSRTALQNIYKESRRLLAPGGVMAHADGLRPSDIFSRYYTEWMAHFNNEPFLGTVQDVDFMALCQDVGFEPHATLVSEASLLQKDDAPDAPDAPGNLGLFVVSARNPTASH